MEKSNKKPLSQGIAKVPMIMQMEALECGAACLTMILAYYRKWVPLEQIRTDCGVSRDGSKAKNILVAARYHGLEAKGYRYEAEDLRTKVTFPCIIHWNFNHFVVLNGIKGNKVSINDPARGTCKLDWKTFDASFTGICMQFTPSEQFEPEGKPKSILDYASKRLRGTGTAVAFTLLTGVIAALMNVISPAFSRVFLDYLLTGQNREWLVPFLVLLGGFNLIHILTTALKGIYELRIKGKMAAVGNTSYMWKVLHLPMSFFSQRMSGDILNRQKSNATISDSLISTLAPMAINTGMMIFYLVLMLRYSPLLTLIGIVSLGLSAAATNYASKKRINLTRVSMMDTAKFYSATTAGIELVESVKASGSENSFFGKWAGYQANVNANDVRMKKMNQYLGIATQILSTVANNVVLVLGVWLIMQGKFTVGMVMTFQGFLTGFMNPASELVNASQTFQKIRTEMERVDDVMEYPSDDLFLSDYAMAEKPRKLTGRLEIRNVEFGYSPLSKPVISDFNMTLEPGKTVAIVGGSGCGKSTMSKLISGLYQPWKGEILFDGKPMNQINKSIFYSSVAVVDQDVILFEDTIENNIKMWDSSIEDYEMILAARDAQIHDDIISRSNGYQHRLMEGGKDLSGGQRQRMEIARVLAQDPTLIILDEATSALDAKTEYNVVQAIQKRGIACVVIAHRLSTIRSCDEIIVLEHGVISARGTHDELMQSSALYNKLVCSE